MLCLHLKMKIAALVIAAAVLAPHLASAGPYVGLAVGPSLDNGGNDAFLICVNTDVHLQS